MCKSQERGTLLIVTGNQVVLFLLRISWLQWDWSTPLQVHVAGNDLRMRLKELAATRVWSAPLNLMRVLYEGSHKEIIDDQKAKTTKA